MDINHDKTAALLNISGSYTAREIESLISDLALLRAKLEPPVPFTPPHGPDEPGNISVQSNPSIAIGRFRDGGGRLYIRNHGIGWLAFDFVQEQLARFRDAVLSRTGDIQNAGELILSERGKDGPRH